jgi:hypothetical protein
MTHLEVNPIFSTEIESHHSVKLMQLIQSVIMNGRF